MKRIVVGSVKADGVESDRECESECSDEYPPAQKVFVRFWLGFSQSFFCKRDSLFVIHVAEEGKKAEDDRKRTNHAKAGKDIVHVLSFPADDSI